MSSILAYPKSALVCEPKCGGREVVAGSQPMSTAVHMEPMRSNTIFNLFPPCSLIVWLFTIIILVMVGVVLVFLLAPVAQELTLHRLGRVPVGMRQLGGEQVLLILILNPLHCCQPLARFLRSIQGKKYLILKGLCDYLQRQLKY